MVERRLLLSEFALWRDLSLPRRPPPVSLFEKVEEDREEDVSNRGRYREKDLS